MKVKPSVQSVLARLRVEVATGKVFWTDPSKHHARLVGAEAGLARQSAGKQPYWHVKLFGYPIKRSHIVFAAVHGRWPTLVDHINGNSLDDRAENLREATPTQNAWNRHRRTHHSQLPMGVRNMKSGRFQARIRVHGHMHHLGTFATMQEASERYRVARRQFFGEFA